MEEANSGYRDCSRKYMDIIQAGLRLDVDNPESSLIYTKPLSGHPVTYSASQAKLLLTWIEAGAENN